MQKVLCVEERLVNSAASRAYCAMFQAAHVALEAAGVGRARWSHPALQAAFTTELIYRRGLYPRTLRAHLSIGLGVRHTADHGAAGVSSTVANRLVRRAAAFVSAVQEGTGHGPRK